MEINLFLISKALVKSERSIAYRTIEARVSYPVNNNEPVHQPQIKFQYQQSPNLIEFSGNRMYHLLFS